MFDDSEEKETFLQRTFGKLDAFEDVTIPDPFINALVYNCNKTKELMNKIKFNGLQASTQNLEHLRFRPKTINKKQVTLGKAIANYVGYPLAATGLYDEIQLVFYPLNHQAGGARIHTTASLPIPIDLLRDNIKKAVSTSSELSVKRAFGIIEKIVRDRNLPAYGIADAYKEVDNFKELEQFEKFNIILSICSNSTGKAALDIGYQPETKHRDVPSFTDYAGASSDEDLKGLYKKFKETNATKSAELAKSVKKSRLSRRSKRRCVIRSKTGRTRCDR